MILKGKKFFIFIGYLANLPNNLIYCIMRKDEQSQSDKKRFFDYGKGERGPPLF